MITYVQTCKICGLKQSASYEHQSDCFGSCDSNTRKIRTREEIIKKLGEAMTQNNDSNKLIIAVLEWVLGEDTL